MPREQLPLDPTLKSAWLSECGRYRYTLERRILGVSGPTLAWLMLNPSKADAFDDDPTVRKVVGFTQRFGFGHALVVNLFALRETHPRNVRPQLATAEGGDNRAALMGVAGVAESIVCAWGATPWARPQAARVLGWFAAHPKAPLKLLCLGTTKDGDPLHPLMPSYDRVLVPFTPREVRRG